MNRKAATDLALRWLTSSGIRHTDGPEIARGGVNQGYNWQERSYPFVYSEIAGYAVSTLVNAHRWTGEKEYLDQAGESAGFLLRLQPASARDGVPGAIPHGLSLPELALQRQYYSFDAAMCLQGLLDLHAVCPDDGLLDASREIGDWLVGHMQKDTGAYLAMHDAVTGEREHAGGDLFGDDGCLHAKHAIGLLKLSAATGDDRYATAAARACDWVLGLADVDGAFHATERVRHVVSHPHCYATEGLLYAYHALGTERYGTAALRAGQWLLDVQDRDGAIHIEYGRRWWRMGRRVAEKLFPRKVTDATSQAVRIWIVLYYLEGDRRFLAAAEKAADFLRRLQCVDAVDPNALGGFPFWPGHPMMFAWCTMFAAHALYALEHVGRRDGYRRLMNELF